MLNKVIGKNRFCGPSVLSSVFGITTDQASKMIREESGYDRTMGVHRHTMLNVLIKNEIEHEYNHINKKEQPTIRNFFNDRDSGIYLFTARNHYAAYCADTKMFSDSGHWGAKKPKSIDLIPNPKAKVTFWIKIISGDIPREAKAKPKLSGKPTSFSEIFEAYASENVKEECRYKTETIAEEVTNPEAYHNFGDDWYKSINPDDEESVNLGMARYYGLQNYDYDAILKETLQDIDS